MPDEASNREHGMSNVFRLAIVDPDDRSREQLKNILLSMDVVWLEAECAKYEFFADVVEQTHPEIGIVSLDNNVEQALALIDSLRTIAPDCSILVISEEDNGQLILNSMRAGAKEFLTRPIRGEDLAAALHRVGSARVTANDGQVRGSSVVAVAGATGGVGTTSVAVNVACALAAQDHNSVALVDLDLALGDADVFLDSIPDYTLVDVAQNISRLDFALLKRSLTKHASGLYLLPRPVQLQDSECVTPDSLHRVIGLLKATFSHLVIDLSKSYTQVDMVAYGRSLRASVLRQRRYPRLARRMELEGTVEVELRLRPDGTLWAAPKVVESSGFEVLDREAVRMVVAAAPFAAPEGSFADTFGSFRIPIQFVLDAE